MRVNIYAEELTERFEMLERKIEGEWYTGIRLYLALPVSTKYGEVRGPFIHREGDDDSGAVTFWVKGRRKNGADVVGLFVRWLQEGE